MPWLAFAVCGLLLCSLAIAAPWDGAWLEQATSTRPLITTFYYPSWPGVQILGLANHDDAELARRHRLDEQAGDGRERHDDARRQHHR